MHRRNGAPAGPISFVVKNTGAVVHELVVIKTDASQDKLAADADEVGKMDETGNVGHYGSGMHRAFTVN